MQLCYQKHETRSFAFSHLLNSICLLQVKNSEKVASQTKRLFLQVKLTFLCTSMLCLRIFKTQCQKNKRQIVKAKCFLLKMMKTENDTVTSVISNLRIDSTLVNEYLLFAHFFSFFFICMLYLLHSLVKYICMFIYSCVLIYQEIMSSS